MLPWILYLIQITIGFVQWEHDESWRGGGDGDQELHTLDR